MLKKLKSGHKITELKFNNLHEISLDNRDWLPKRNTVGVYVFCDSCYRPLYVGKSVDIRSRFSQHCNDNASSVMESILSGEAKYFSWAEVNEELLALYESYYIYLYKPLLNSDGICRKNRKKHKPKPVYMIDKVKQTVVKKYNDIEEAEKDGFTKSGIMEVLRGAIKTHKGYIWKYEI